MSTITAIIINKKEDDDLEKCLKTTKQFSDEIIILDYLKSDKVMITCRDSKYIYIEVESAGIKKYLNKAIKGTQSDYLLFLNSNEYMSGQLRNSLVSVHGNMDCDAYRINVLKNYYGQWMKHAGLYPDFQIRLVKRQSGYHIEDKIERITIPGEIKKIDTIAGDLLCVQYRNIWKHIQTINDITEAEANMLYKERVKSNILKMIFQPFSRFLSLFFVKMGFLDGFYGMTNAVISGYSFFLKQVKLRELWKNIEK